MMLLLRLAHTILLQLKVYNLMGQIVDVIHDGMLHAGFHSIKWNAARYSSGIYFVHMVTEHNQSTQKLMLIK